ACMVTLDQTLAGRKKRAEASFKISTDDSPDDIRSRDVHKGGGRRRPLADTRALCGRNRADRRPLQRSRRSKTGTVPTGRPALPKRFRSKVLRHQKWPVREVRIVASSWFSPFEYG